MPTPVFLGEFEQLVLLALLDVSREEGDAPALALRERMEEIAGRSVSRGALYRTLDRLEDKGWVDWALDDEDVPERGGHPRRRFCVSREGLDVLQASKETLEGLWARVGEALG